MKGLLIGLILYSFLSVAAPVIGQESPPAKYTPLYNSLSNQLNVFEQTIDADWNKTLYPTIYAAELLTANAHVGEKLLTDQGYAGVILMLDRFQQLGITGVKINVSYPLFEPEFPRSAEYIAFYKKLAQEIKRRNMKMLIQSTALFPDPVYTPLPVDYTGLTFEQFKEGKKRTMQIILNEMEPDFLTVDMEPTTEAHNTKLTELVIPAKAAELVSYITTGLDKGSTKIGAGTGTWEHPNFITLYYVNIPALDYIDLHIYPVNFDFLSRAIQYADSAKTHNKKLIMSEAWLYKASDTELSNAAANSAIFSRDVYSFWSPLDQQLLRIITKLGHYKEFELISPFWTTYFFSYLEYTQATEALTPGQRIALGKEEAAKKLVANTFSSTGLYYKSLITANSQPTPTNQPTSQPSTTDVPCSKKPQGDANCDGIIDLIDFEMWRKEYTGSVSTKIADFDANGSVTLTDFEIWRKAYFM